MRKLFLVIVLAFLAAIPMQLLAQSNAGSNIFTQYAIGINPSTVDWTVLNISGGCGDIKVIELAASELGGKVLRHKEQAFITSRICALLWDESASSLNAEGLALIRALNLSGGTGITLRSGSGTGYVFTTFWASDIVGIQRIVGTSVSFIGSSVPFTFAPNTWYWVRFQTEDTNLRGKIWQHGSSEPSNWTLERTDSNIETAGVSGLFLRIPNDTSTRYVDGFAFSNNLINPPCLENCLPPPVPPEGTTGRLPIMEFDWESVVGTFGIFLLLIVGVTAGIVGMAKIGVPTYVFLPIGGIALLLAIRLEIVPIWLIFAAIFLFLIIAMIYLKGKSAADE